MIKRLVFTITGLKLEPTTVMIDFEDATRAAAKHSFPGVEVLGCKFHFSSNMVKHIKEYELTKVYHEESRTLKGIWIRAFFGLHYLPIDEVQEAADVLMRFMPQDKRCRKFCNYILKNYIYGITEEKARFPPELWAGLFKTEEEKLLTTSNSAERHNKLVNSVFTNRDKPTAPSVIFRLMLLQEFTYVSLNSIKDGKKNKETTRLVQYEKAMQDSRKNFENSPQDPKDVFIYLYAISQRKGELGSSLMGICTNLNLEF